MSVIYALKNLFAVFGIPKIIKSDRGLQFNSHMFRKFSFLLNMILSTFFLTHIIRRVRVVRRGQSRWRRGY